MLGVSDDQMDLAAEKLFKAGFIRESWSFGTTVDPTTRKDDEGYQDFYARIKVDYANFDAKTIRFHCPDIAKYTEQVVLIPSSYIYLDASEDPSYALDHGFVMSSQPSFYVRDNLYYANAVLLLQSIITVVLAEREHLEMGSWHRRLHAWAYTYLYGELSLRDDVLDTCKDERVKEYFNELIKRGTGVSRVREKWGRPRALITNNLIKEFQ